MKTISKLCGLVLLLVALNTPLKAQSTPGLYLTYLGNDGGPNFVNYWKNGQVIKLSDGKTFAEALDIVVSGDDVYVSGYVNNSASEPVAMYWKNDKAIILSDGKTYSKALALAVSGSDVHLIGNIGSTAVYWKNRVATKMGKDITLTDIFVAGQDVYISGYQVDENGDYQATYWKNGKAVKLASANPGAEANGIAVSGTNVYVAGKAKDKEGIEIAVYWKNGKETLLANGTSAQAISLSGNDVYIAGFERNAELINIMVSWKNGQPSRLTDGKESAGIYAMAVSGQDVYLVGYREGNPTYWKNGKAISPPNITGHITGIFVK